MTHDDAEQRKADASAELPTDLAMLELVVQPSPSAILAGTRARAELTYARHRAVVSAYIAAGILCLAVILALVTRLNWDNAAVASALAVTGAGLTAALGTAIGSALSLPGRKNRFDRINQLVAMSGQGSAGTKESFDGPQEQGLEGFR